MKVDTILARKGTHVETASRELPVLEAAQRLSGMRIGSLVVCDDGGRVVGIIDERDIVRAIANCGSLVLDLSVGVVMRGRPASRCAGSSASATSSRTGWRRSSSRSTSCVTGPGCVPLSRGSCRNLSAGEGRLDGARASEET